MKTYLPITSLCLCLCVIFINAAQAEVNGSIAACNETRLAALAQCEALPAADQAACIASAWDAYEACISAAISMSDAQFIRGDANRDGTVNLADPIFVLDELFGQGNPSSCPDASDANDDGRLDIADPIAMLDLLFKEDHFLPPPMSSPGADATGDVLRCFGGGEGIPAVDLIQPRDLRTATFSLG